MSLGAALKVLTSTALLIQVTVTCADGYYVAGTATCQKVFTVTCFDGALTNKQVRLADKIRHTLPR